MTALVIRRSVAILVVACAGALSAGCGGKTVATKASWTQSHGAAITALDTQLNFARQAIDSGDRQSILESCNLLTDDLATARQGLPVPNVAVDAALRTGLEAVSVGASDCVKGAQVASSASLNEKAMAELTAARMRMDTADQAIAAWA